jgi:hypothetical protein
MEAHGHSRRNRLKTTRELRELLRELTVKFPDEFPTIPSPSLQASRF